MDEPAVAIRRAILAQHQELRARFGELRKALAEVGGGKRPSRELAPYLARLRESVATHNAFEDATLRPLVSKVDAWGEVRVDNMAARHVEEHQSLEQALAAFDLGAHRPDILVRDLEKTLMALETHMVDEERELLDPLTDDSPIRSDASSS